MFRYGEMVSQVTVNHLFEVRTLVSEPKCVSGDDGESHQSVKLGAKA